MSERWWRRRKRSDFGFEGFFEEADMMEKTIDDLIRRAFGNHEEKNKARRDYLYRPRNPCPSRSIGSHIKEEYEPLVDMFVDAADVVVGAELLGVGKDCIEVTATENSLTIQVNSSKGNYFKELALPVEVDPKSMAPSYRNGVLEVRLRKQIREGLFLR